MLHGLWRRDVPKALCHSNLRLAAPVRNFKIGLMAGPSGISLPSHVVLQYRNWRTSATIADMFASDSHPGRGTAIVLIEAHSACESSTPQSTEATAPLVEECAVLSTILTSSSKAIDCMMFSRMRAATLESPPGARTLWQSLRWLLCPRLSATTSFGPPDRLQRSAVPSAPLKRSSRFRPQWPTCGATRTPIGGF